MKTFQFLALFSMALKVHRISSMPLLHNHSWLEHNSIEKNEDHLLLQISNNREILTAAAGKPSKKPTKKPTKKPIKPSKKPTKKPIKPSKKPSKKPNKTSTVNPSSLMPTVISRRSVKPSSMQSSKSHSWQCGIGGFLTPMRVNANNDVECMANDYTNCFWENDMAHCLADVKTPPNPLYPLACGEAHKRVYGNTGYDTPGHWCYVGSEYLRYSLAPIPKPSQKPRLPNSPTLLPTPTIQATNFFPKLYYKNGPVIPNVNVVTIFWGGSSSISYASKLEQFYTALTKSDWYKQLSEYSTPNLAIGFGSWLKSYSDTSAPTGTVTYSQIQTRLTSLIQSGAVPPPDQNTYYAIHLSPAASGTGDGFCVQWCGYHSAFSYNGVNVYFGLMPDNSNCCCCGNGFDGITMVSAHELAEAVTDPWPGTGWYGTAENGDYCAWNWVAAVGYQVQKLWSNRAQACVANATTVTTPTNQSFRLTAGGIKSKMNGKCVDVPGANFVSGAQIQMWDCYGNQAQIWWRSSSSDLRLQTSNNLCMDATGDQTGGPVVINPCSNASSQQWIFDGQNLRPMHNTALCLNIKGADSGNGATLLAYQCDYGINSAWIQA